MVPVAEMCRVLDRGAAIEVSRLVSETSRQVDCRLESRLIVGGPRQASLWPVSLDEFDKLCIHLIRLDQEGIVAMRCVDLV